MNGRAEDVVADLEVAGRAEGAESGGDLPGGAERSGEDDVVADLVEGQNQLDE